MPSTLTQQLSGIAPWRRAVTIVLLIAGVAILVLAVAGVLETSAIIGSAVVVALSFLVGPRSPFFRSEPA